MAKYETTHFSESLGNETQSGNEIWPVDVTLKMKFFIKKLYNKSGQGASSRLFFEFSKDPP